jgi:hypothetical protein
MQEVLTLDIQSAILAGEIDASLTLAGRPIGVADVMVAAIAIHHGLTLVSGNETHYEAIREAGYPLVIENWRRVQYRASNRTDANVTRSSNISCLPEARRDNRGSIGLISVNIEGLYGSFSPAVQMSQLKANDRGTAESGVVSA